MNIKEHIEAGHYPLDEKGRALVPMLHGGHAEEGIVISTDVPGPYPIVVAEKSAPSGYEVSLHNEFGECIGKRSGQDLKILPPSPKKVKVSGWAAFTCRGTRIGTFDQEHDAHACSKHYPDYRIVELTGEYEEPWA